VRKNYDPRMYILAHWAMVGLKSHKAKQSAQKKVVKVPQIGVPSQNGGGQKGAKGQMIANKKAMHQLSKTGRLKDAMNVNF